MTTSAIGAQLEILDVLGERKCVAAIDDIAKLVHTADPAVSEAAAFALAKTGSPLAYERLIQAYQPAAGAHRS